VSAADWAAEGVPNSAMVQKPFANAQVLTAIATLLDAVDVSPFQPQSEWVSRHLDTSANYP
jgi:hypothetical protein